MKNKVLSENPKLSEKIDKLLNSSESDKVLKQIAEKRTNRKKMFSQLSLNDEARRKKPIIK